MKKTELVHLHTLLVQVAEEFVARGDASPADFAAYDRLQITPLSLRASRSDHETAVRALARALAERSDAAAEERPHASEMLS